MFVILTSSEADAVRGPTTPPAALNPIERAGGAFILSVAVLSDVAHESHWPFLADLPQMDSTDPGFPGELEGE